MFCIAVTLDVSKLSGWLNTDAPCRVERKGHTMWDEIRDKRAWCMRRHSASGLKGRLRLNIGRRKRAVRTRNIQPMVVTLEVSQLEMSALKFFKL